MSRNVAFDLLLAEVGRLGARIGEQQAKLAAELAVLKQRAASLRERLHEVRETEPGALQDLKTELDLELHDLAEAFERWLDNR